MNKILDLLNNKNNSVENIKKRNSGIVSVFKSTILSLQESNKQIISAQEFRNTEIEKLSSEVSELDNIIIENNNVINNITKIFNN